MGHRLWSNPMPHLTLEYSDNLDFDVQSVLARLHTELVATGAINLKGIKSRAIRLCEYRIADGNPEYAFVHVNLLIRQGRPLETQQEAARRVMRVLKETFGDRFDQSYLSLSVDIKEMRDEVALTLHNIPAVQVD
jgi:5-carboxymethyl-2-hydroxymuconate isomerase